MMKTILALVGDYWHNGDMIEEALAAAAAIHGAVNIKSITHMELVKELKAKPDAVVMFKGNFLGAPSEPRKQWMTPEISAAIAEYVRTGGSWLAWHSGMAGYAKDSEYASMLRGIFIHHPKMKTVIYYDTATGEEVLTLHDEHYFVECCESETEVFMTSTSDDGKSIAGWAHHFGEGKVCCLTPAHTREGLLDDRFQSILVQRLQLLL